MYIVIIIGFLVLSSIAWILFVVKQGDESNHQKPIKRRRDSPPFEVHNPTGHKLPFYV